MRKVHLNQVNGCEIIFMGLEEDEDVSYEVKGLSKWGSSSNNAYMRFNIYIWDGQVESGEVQVLSAISSCS